MKGIVQCVFFFKSQPLQMLLNNRFEYDKWKVCSIVIFFQGDGTTETRHVYICCLTTYAVVSCFHTYGMLEGSALALVRSIVIIKHLLYITNLCIIHKC
jgi:hypothetical protein